MFPNSNKEIERKFLVRKDFWYAIRKPAGVAVRQGYLVSDPEKTVRVRIMGEQGYLTIKGPAVNSVRDEFEYPIPKADAEALLEKFTNRRIDKVRYRIELSGHTWEVDEFFGANEGLVVGEIELDHPEQSFEKPDWIGEEVTDDHRYSNSSLAEYPFTAW